MRISSPCPWLTGRPMQGGTCGFGNRGQKCRSGSGTRPGFEGGQTPMYRRLPKLRGIAGGERHDMACSMIWLEHVIVVQAWGPASPISSSSTWRTWRSSRQALRCLSTLSRSRSSVSLAVRLASLSRYLQAERCCMPCMLALLNCMPACDTSVVTETNCVQYSCMNPCGWEGGDGCFYTSPCRTSISQCIP